LTFTQETLTPLTSTLVGRGKKDWRGQRARESKHTYLFAMVEALHVVVTEIHAFFEMRSRRLVVMVMMM
jgi:hypothetical protein